MKKEIPLYVLKDDDREMLEKIQAESYDFFRPSLHPEVPLIADSTAPGVPASVAVMGLALTAYPVAVQRGFILRDEALDRTIKILRFFKNSEQSTDANATGFQGFYYHFLEMETGRRAWGSELSTIDTAIFIAGALASATFFDRDEALEAEIRTLADELYRRVNWKWATNGENTLTHGWLPESGFIPHRWSRGYNEAHILYLLALASPTYPIEREGYDEWTSHFDLRTYYGTEYFYAGPLFIHQMSQVWLDFRGIRDEAGRKAGFDYFENSKRATEAQRKYAIENPHQFERYGEFCWGFTAGDGPGPAKFIVKGKKRTFYNYIARGAPEDIDDGTISPWAVVTSVPFAPEITLPTIRRVVEILSTKAQGPDYCFHASFNATFPEPNTFNPDGWVSPYIFGLNQGPSLIMIENYLSGSVWKLMQKCEYLQEGLKLAGFQPAAPL